MDSIDKTDCVTQSLHRWTIQLVILDYLVLLTIIIVFLIYRCYDLVKKYPISVIIYMLRIKWLNLNFYF